MIPIFSLSFLLHLLVFFFFLSRLCGRIDTRLVRRFSFFFTCSYLFWFDLSLFFQRFCGITVDVKFSFLTIWFAQVTLPHKIQREQQQRRWRRQRRQQQQQAASANFLWFLPWGFHTFQFTRVIGMFEANQVIKCDSVVFFGGSVTTTHTARATVLSYTSQIILWFARANHPPPPTTKSTRNYQMKNVKLQRKVFCSLASCAQENLLKRIYSVILAQFYAFPNFFSSLAHLEFSSCHLLIKAVFFPEYFLAVFFFCCSNSHNFELRHTIWFKRNVFIQTTTNIIVFRNGSNENDE